MSTHNSYEKKPLGILESLDYGARMVEFDIRTTFFSSNQDYCIGHLICYDPTTQNGKLGNPDTHFIKAWLQQIRNWSLAHPDHAPITVMVDLKHDLSSGGKGYAEGGFPFLQEMWLEVFGDSAYWASEKPGGTWPTVDELRGRIIGMLSGSRNARIFYQQDEGYKPQVSVNDAGLVVETHQNQYGRSIYYWTGRITDAGISWFRHGKVDSGRESWPALGNDNTVVEVHKSENFDRLFYRVGTLDEQLEISWGPSKRYDSGELPGLRFTSSGQQVQERHLRSGKVWVRNGTVDAASKEIKWQANSTQVDVPLFDSIAKSPSGAKVVEVQETDTWVEYRVGGQGRFKKISYEQVFFMDWQPGCSGDGENYPPLSTGSFIGVSRRCDKVKRMDGVATRVWQWSMDDERNGRDGGNMPATDYPDEEYKAWVLSKPYGIEY